MSFNVVTNANMRPTRSRGGITAEIADALANEPNGTVIFVPVDSGYSGEPQSLYHVCDAAGFAVAVQPTINGTDGMTERELGDRKPIGWLIARKPRTAKRDAQIAARNAAR